jgi:hypothetical protein
MPKKSRWQTLSLLWKVVGGVCIILGGVASILQIFGAVDFWGLLILPLHAFLTSSVPIYYVVLLVIGIFVALYLLSRAGYYGSSILDNDYGRHLAITCQTPRTTDYLRRKFEERHERDRSWGGYTFENTMKLLEGQGFLKYQNGEWEVTDKALDYINKYHGD